MVHTSLDCQFAWHPCAGPAGDAACAGAERPRAGVRAQARRELRARRGGEIASRRDPIRAHCAEESACRHVGGWRGDGSARRGGAAPRDTPGGSVPTGAVLHTAACPVAHCQQARRATASKRAQPATVRPPRPRPLPFVGGRRAASTHRRRRRKEPSAAAAAITQGLRPMAREGRSPRHRTAWPGAASRACRARYARPRVPWRTRT